MAQARQTKFNPKHHEAHLQQKLRRNLIALIIIPASVLIAFIFFGPKIGVLFGLVSVNRGNENRVVSRPTMPIIRDAPKATKNNTVTLSGFAESGTVVRLFVNGPQVEETVTASDGVFTFENVQLIEGRNTIHAKAVNRDGEESEKSQSVNILVDNRNPEIEVTAPKDGDTVRNLDERVAVQGKVNEKASIRVNDRLAVLRPDNTFELLLGLKEGENAIKVVATDEAGNSSTQEFTITYVKRSDQ